MPPSYVIFLLMLLFLLFDIHHKHLQPVLDIGKADIRVIIQRQDLRVRIFLLQLLRDSPPHYMVRQTSERLQDDKGTAPFLRMVQDFARDQDPLSCVKSMRDNGIALFCQVFDPCRLLIKRMF